MFFLAQRALIALCLISLLGCSSPACRQWEIQEVITKTPRFNTGRLLLAPHSDYSYLELELVRNRSGIRFYLNLLFLNAPPYEDNPAYTTVEIVFEDQEPWVVYPHLFAGGQRLLLPGDVADRLIQALLDDISFTIRLGRSHVVVIPTNFTAVYERLLALPIEEELPDMPSTENFSIE